MARRTRKNKRTNRNKTRHRRGGGAGSAPTPLPAGATLAQVTATLNNVIVYCCGAHSSLEKLKKPKAPSAGGAAFGGRKKKKRGKNEFFTKMLAAKAAKAPSFEYKGMTYKATKGGSAGQLVVYKKA